VQLKGRHPPLGAIERTVSPIVRKKNHFGGKENSSIRARAGNRQDLIQKKRKVSEREPLLVNFLANRRRGGVE